MLRESSAEAKKIYADEKCYRKFCLSEQRGDLSRTLSLHTSSKASVYDGAIINLEMLTLFRIV